MVRLRKETHLEEISSASMSDVAFLLLVFFMVASVFYVKEGLSSTLPKKNSAPEEVRRELVYKFRVGPRGVVIENPALGSKSFAYGPELQTGLAALEIPEIKKKYAILRTEQGVHVKDVVGVMAAAKERGFIKISVQRGRR